MRALLLLLLWDNHQMWMRSASGMNPGGGGIIGTGGARDYYITCANCHLKSDTQPNQYGSIDLRLTFMPPLGSAGGAEAYSPGQTYQIAVDLLGEHLGLAGCSQFTMNVNNFSAAFEDSGGRPAGVLISDSGQRSDACPASVSDTIGGTTVTFGDCHAIWSTGGMNRTQWGFSWTAPAAGTGAITLYYGAVDGNCTTSSIGDDVKVGRRTLVEAQAAAAPPRGRVWWFALAAVLPAGWWLRRRRQGAPASE